MCKDIIPPKEKIIKNLLRSNRKIEENDKNIILYWRETPGDKIKAIFGKRSDKYYKCEPDLACMCFGTSTRSVDLKTKDSKTKDSKTKNLRTVGLDGVEFNKKALGKYEKKGWKRLFDGKKFAPKGGKGETVVIEEYKSIMMFYFTLSNKVKANVSFTIENDLNVICARARECATKSGGRITYTTFLKLIQGNAAVLLN